MNRLVTALLVSGGMAWVPATARAAFGDPELRAELGGGYDCYFGPRRIHGGGAAAQLQYAFGPSWAVLARYGVGLHDMRDADFVLQHVDLGGRYQLDIFEYVPWLELAPGVYTTSGEGGPADDPATGLRIALGFDRLLGDIFSVGLGVHYHRLFSEDRFPAWLELHAGIGIRWGFGDPLAP